MKVLVCGGRYFTGLQAVITLGNALLAIHKETPITEIIHGAARGADTLAEKFGEYFGIPTRAFPADWKKYKNSAGPIRNKQMLVEGNPDVVVAFPGGAGTANMVSQAIKHKVKVIVVDNPPNTV